MKYYPYIELPILGKRACYELQNTGRNIERLLAKTVLGLCTRIIAKITSYILKYVLLANFNVKVFLGFGLIVFHIKR